jgi:Mg-chelatase subunit ChlD
MPSFGGLGQVGNPFATSVHNFKDDDPLEHTGATTVLAEGAVVLQPEPDPDANDGALFLNARVEFSALARGRTQDVFGLVTMQAADQAARESSEERQPMDLVCVLDVSGSMRSSDKLHQVQQAMQFVIDQADPKDRISIVAFNDSAGRVIRLTKMNQQGKMDCKVATLKLSAGGGTSIAAGWEMALSVMEQRRQRNKVSAILLLTDGQDYSTRSRVPEIMKRTARANCALYAFGFGKDHDAALLSEIAEHAQTPFTFVEDTNKVGEAFAGAVGGISSIVAQQVQLNLKGRVPLKAIHTPFPLQRLSDMEVIVTIPDMFANERRDILVELSVPTQNDGAEQTLLLEVSAQYIDLKRNCTARTPSVAMEAKIVDEPQPEAEPDEEVRAQRDRVEVTRTLNDAAAASDRGQFDEAQRMLDGAEQRLNGRKKSPVSEAMVLEVQDARNRMQNRSAWEVGGRAEVRDALQMHSMQRCTNTTPSYSSISSRGAVQKSSKTMYCSPNQMAWISKQQSSA